MERFFDSSYYELFSEAVQRPEGILIPQRNYMASRNLRTNFYHFRRYLREEMPEFLGGRFESLKFHIEPGGLRVKTRGSPGQEEIQQALHQ